MSDVRENHMSCKVLSCTLHLTQRLTPPVQIWLWTEDTACHEAQGYSSFAGWTSQSICGNAKIEILLQTRVDGVEVELRIKHIKEVKFWNALEVERVVILIDP